MVQNHYPLPLISKIREKIVKVKVYFTFNILNTFNYQRIKKGNKYKMAFRTYNRYY